MTETFERLEGSLSSLDSELRAIQRHAQDCLDEFGDDASECGADADFERFVVALEDAYAIFSDGYDSLRYA